MKTEKIVVAFDTETTGLIKPEITDIKKQPEIIELYMAKLIHRKDGVIEQIDELDTFLKPQFGEVSPTITKITNITPEMVANAPTFGQKFKEIAEFNVGVHAWVAHNCAFDTAMMANEIARVDKIVHFPFPPEKICTVQKTMHIEQRRMSLSNLYQHLFGEQFPDAHRAKADVQAMIRCYKELCAQGVI